jgi:hypothetical protein
MKAALSRTAWLAACVAWSLAPSGSARSGQEGEASPLREPSGLAATPLRDGAGAPLVLAVDDELAELWFLAPAAEGGAQKHHALALTTPVEDLEALAFDARPGEGRLYAVTSHRRHDEPDETVIVRRALGPDAREEALRIPPAAIAAALARASVTVEVTKKDRIRIDGRPWWKKEEDERHPYALEIEAAACWGDELLLGVKHPLAPDGAALVLAVALDALAAPPDSRLELPAPLLELDQHALRVLRLDLGGHGATAMCADPATGDLLVASNPAIKPGKPGAGDATSADAYGRSLVHRLRREGDALAPAAAPLPLGRADAKLEGLAVVDDEVWLAYDGDAPAIVRVPRGAVVR